MSKLLYFLKCQIKNGPKNCQNAKNQKSLELRPGQVRKLMDTPGLRYQQETVASLCASLIANDKFEALDKFVALSKNIFGCDRDYLYRRLLEAHKEDADKVPKLMMNDE